MNPIYEGFFIKEDLHGKLAKNIEYKHITTEFKPRHPHEDLYGITARFAITGYGNDDNNEGYLVKLVSCESDELVELFNNISVPHITLSTSIDGKPVNTKNLEFKPFDGGIITATFGGFLGKPILSFDLNRPDSTSNHRRTNSGLEQMRVSKFIDHYTKRVRAVYDTYNSAAIHASQAEKLLARAEKALIDFNRTNDIFDKNLILASGVNEAFLACKSYLNAIVCGDGPGSSIYNEIDSDGSYRALYNEINASGYGILENMIMFTSGNNYSEIRHSKDYPEEMRRDYRTIPIYEDGLKIYHLKAMIDYSKKLRQALILRPKYTNLTTSTNTEMLKYINDYSQKADNKFVSLNIFYNENFNISPDQLSEDTILEACIRLRNMFNDYLTALIIYEYTDDTCEEKVSINNLNTMSVQDKLKKVINVVIHPAYMKITGFSEDLEKICNAADRRNISGLPNAIKFVCLVDEAKEVVLAIKEFLGLIVTNQLAMIENPKAEVKI